MTEQTIPVVSLKDWNEGDAAARARFVKTVGEALEDIGFFALEDHGVEQSLIHEAYAAAGTFFRLPEDVKKRYEVPELLGQRGYVSFGKEHAKDSEAPDLKEFWHVGRELPNGHTLEGDAYPDNIWPDDDVPEYRVKMSKLYEQLDACAAALLEACALHVGAPQRTFADMAVDGQTVLRVIHYPPIPEDANPASVRAAAHEDINLITLLCESTASGLELLQRDGTWRPIESVSGQIIVDAGDMLQWATNGQLKSTTHRVVNPGNSRERRFSMPFFVHPRPAVDLTPLEVCVQNTGGERRFAPITAGQYLQQRLEEIGMGKK